MTRKLLPLVGTNSLLALSAFNTLLLGLKCLPAYLDIEYVTFYESFKTKTEREKEDALRQAAAFVQLTPKEVEALVSFATDANGIPYGAANKGSLAMAELFEIIVAVCMEIGRIEIDLVSDGEKKKSPISQSTYVELI